MLDNSIWQLYNSSIKLSAGLYTRIVRFRKCRRCLCASRLHLSVAIASARCRLASSEGPAAHCAAKLGEYLKLVKIWHRIIHYKKSPNNGYIITEHVYLNKESIACGAWKICRLPVGLYVSYCHPSPREHLLVNYHENGSTGKMVRSFPSDGRLSCPLWW